MAKRKQKTFTRAELKKKSKKELFAILVKMARKQALRVFQVEATVAERFPIFRSFKVKATSFEKAFALAKSKLRTKPLAKGRRILIKLSLLSNGKTEKIRSKIFKLR